MTPPSSSGPDATPGLYLHGAEVIERGGGAASVLPIAPQTFQFDFSQASNALLAALFMEIFAA